MNAQPKDTTSGLIATLATAALMALAATGCTETSFQEATGKGSIRGIHAIAGLADVNFLIEERSIGSVTYKASTSTSRFDNLSYVFNFDLPRLGASVRRIASRQLDVVADTAYIFTLAGTPGDEEVLLWERPEREWSETDTVFDINIAHASTTLDSVDVYIAADGTLPVAGNQAGTVSFGGYLDARDYEAGEYEIIATPAGDPATILYRGTTVTLNSAESYTLVFMDADPNITGPVAARVINSSGATIEVADERFPPTLQFINTSFETGNIDIAIDSDFANLAVTDLAHGQVSADIDVPVSADYQFVPTGTTTPVLDTELPAAPGSRSLVLLAGDTGGIVVIVLPAARRGYDGVARFRLTNTITDTDVIDVFVTEPGTEIDASTLPVAFAAAIGFSITSTRADGDYEVTVTENGNRDRVLVDALPISMTSNEIVEIVLLDTADPNVADALTFTN